MNRIEKIKAITKLEKLNRQADMLIEGHGGTMNEEMVESLKQYIESNELKIKDLQGERGNQ